jgi:Zn-dependent M28 family amino/carboxypeptidase
VLKELPLRDSVWFVATDAEELGSLGSAHMVEWLADEGWDVQGVVAPDMIGYWPLGNDDAFDILGDDASAWMVNDVAATADTLGVANKTWIRHAYCYGDDHTNFQESDFSAISPMDCVEAHNVSSSDEATPHYHQTTDTIDTLHLPFTTRVVGVITATIAGWAGA